MNRYICIHGHFYQPPRENPWLEEVEIQDSAYPYHDWNARVTAECYAPNTAARILGPDKMIIDIVNNYSRMSFNFGPTLLSWMERHEPEIYKAIIDADRLSQVRFSGHGSALAQIYGHIIMPLANSRDKRTQVIWGIRDFVHRFGRQPEGMWLSETAADLETLDLLAEYGIKFTILAPRQAHKIRKIGEDEWQDVSGGKIDPRRPYLCQLPSGRSITLFFYDGPISMEVAFGVLLNDGEAFAKNLAGAFLPDRQDEPQLVHVATDGETFGHHHPFGDMALAYGSYYIESNQIANLTIYGEYLEKYPAAFEVEIFENSSWSCIHGVERWKNDCGCNTGIHGGWHQKWRAPLRKAMDWLMDALSKIFEEQAARCVNNPWEARDEYISLILDRAAPNVDAFLAKYALQGLSHDDKINVLKLMEMQRHAMLMYTSCGWFFDEISGIETVQVIMYAARAIQLARETFGIDLEPEYIKLLEAAPSNLPRFGNGSRVYGMQVKPAVLDILRVGAHYAIACLFDTCHKDQQLYCYTTESPVYDRVELGKQRLVIGKANLKSLVTWERGSVCYAVLHLGDHNLVAGVHLYSQGDPFVTVHQEIKDSFLKGDVLAAIAQIDKHFGAHGYSLWHLFKDEQRRIMNRIIAPGLDEVKVFFAQTYKNNYPVIQAMRGMGMPVPQAFSLVMGFTYNAEIYALLESPETDYVKLGRLIGEVKFWAVKLDEAAIKFVAKRKANDLFLRFYSSPNDMPLLENLGIALETLDKLPLQLNLWEAQNIYFMMGRNTFKEMQGKSAKGDRFAMDWVTRFKNLERYLQVRIL